MNIKIIDVTVHVIKSDLDIPFAFSQGWVKKRSATIVEVKTNDEEVKEFKQACNNVIRAAQKSHSAIKDKVYTIYDKKK